MEGNLETQTSFFEEFDVNMEFLAGYGSDEEEQRVAQGFELPARTRFTPEKAVEDGILVAKHSKSGNDLDVKGLHEAQATRKRRRAGLAGPRVGSKWRKASAFLSPVAYDKEDVGTVDEEEHTERSRLLPKQGERPSLKQILPPPQRGITNKEDQFLGQDDAATTNIATKEEMYKKWDSCYDRKSGFSIDNELRPSQEVYAALPESRVEREAISAAPEVYVPVQYSDSNVHSRNITTDTIQSELMQGGMRLQEVSGDVLRATGPGPVNDSDALKTALGPEYENMVRAQAAKVGSIPKRAKAKHQLSALFQQAKHDELAQLEKRSLSTKTKAETQKKYGW